MAEAFKLNSSPVDGDSKSDSLIDMFESLEANKQCETTKPDIGPVDASSFSAQNPARAENHSEASKSRVNSHFPFSSFILLWRFRRVKSKIILVLVDC